MTYFVSKRGICFTKHAVQGMSSWLREMQEQEGQNITISYSVAFIQDGALQIALGAEYGHQENALRDEVEGLEFSWLADEELLAALSQYSIDNSYGEGSRLLPLVKSPPAE